MTVSRNKLTKKDITDLAVLSILEQCPFCYERMQAGGYTATLAPTLKKIYGDQKEELGNALGRKTVIGSITRDQLRQIAEYKLPDLNSNDIEAAMKVIEGTANNMGIVVKD